MEVSALRYSGGIGLHARSPLLRLQSDERLVSLIRRGSTTAFEVLVARYNARLLAFCRHLLGSREDAEDVLQEVFSAAFNAILDDDRPINVRPWLYRIARNRSLNHLRRIQAVGVDSMDIHLSDHGSTTADKVHEREEFRLLVGDIHNLPETQRTALVLREMDALSYEQISEAMETTVPSVKSLLVRARVSLAEAAEARMLTCDEVREELGEVAEGLLRRPGPLVRRHLRTCERCSTFKSQLNETSKSLAAVLPIAIGMGGAAGPFNLLRKLAILHIGHSAGAGSSASGASAAGQAAAVGSTAAAGASAVMGGGSTGFISASVGAIATKAAAGLAAAALVTAGAVEVDHSSGRARPVDHHPATSVASLPSPTTVASTPAPVRPIHFAPVHRRPAVTHPHKASTTTAAAAATQHKASDKSLTKQSATATTKSKTKTLPGRTQTQTAATVLPAQTTTSTVTTTPASTCTDTSDSTTSPTTTETTTTTPAASSDPGTTSSTPTQTTTTPTGTTSTTGDSSDTTSTPTQTTSTPPPAPAGDYTCSTDSSGTGSTEPSGGTAP